MQLDGVPAWCRWRLADAPLLLVAPHGGRCDAPAPADAHERWRVNDLHTAELTMTLAARLNASFVTNTALDRNELDLNRISEVTRGAPWFLHLLESLLTRLLQQHRTVQILFIHGWNVIQPKCDIGIGARLATLTELPQRRATLTASPEYVHSRLESFRTHCASAGVHTSYGERYPASHPNNVLQLFRRHDTPRGPRTALTQWAAAGRLQAVQLELAVPLRWQGALRDRFLTAATQAFSSASPVPASSLAPPAIALCAPPASLMLCVPGAGLGLIAGVSGPVDQRISGRLLVFDERGRVALFTGEDAGSSGSVLGGPQFIPQPSGFELCFNGSLLEVDDGSLYLRLERAFARARLIDARVALAYHSIGSGAHGRVTGEIQLEGRRAPVDGLGFAQTALLQRVVPTPPVRVAFAATFGGETAISVRRGAGDTCAPLGGAAEPAGVPPQPFGARVAITGSPDQPASIAIWLDDGRVLSAWPTNRILIHRPVAGGGFELVNLGIARFVLNGETQGAGVFEYARQLQPARAMRGTAAPP